MVNSCEERSLPEGVARYVSLCVRVNELTGQRGEITDMEPAITDTSDVNGQLCRLFKVGHHSDHRHT